MTSPAKDNELVQNPLREAIERGDHDAVIELQQAGFRVTPEILRVAIAQGDRAIFQLLDTQGIDLEPDYYSIALQHRNLRLFDVLRKLGVTPPPSLVTEAARMGWARAVKALHERGLSVTYENAIEPALAVGAIDVVVYCVESADINLSLFEPRGFELVSDPKTAPIVRALATKGLCKTAAVVLPLAQKLHDLDLDAARQALANSDPVATIDYLIWLRETAGERNPECERQIDALFEEIGRVKHWLRASVVGDDAVIRALLRMPHSFPATDRRRALRLASANGQLAVVEILHQSGVSFEGEAADVIVVAAANGRREVVEYLVRNGADPAYDGWAAGLAAVKGRHLDVLVFLHENGLPLALVEDVIPGLITTKGALDVLTYFERETGSSGAVSGAKIAEALRSGDPEKLLTALAKNSSNFALPQLLTLAAELGDTAAIRRLAQRAASLPSAAATALVAAASAGHLEIVRYLVNNGVDPDDPGGSALVVAAENGHLEVVRFLTKNGVACAKANSECLAAVQFNGHFEVYDYLTSHGADGIAEHRPAIDAMMSEIVVAAETYKPSKVQRRLCQAHMEQLKLSGIERFKRTVNQSYFNFSPTGLSSLDRLANRKVVRSLQSRLTVFDPDRVRGRNYRLLRADLRIFNGLPRLSLLPSGLGRRLQLAVYRRWIAELWAKAVTADSRGLTERLCEPRFGTPIESWLDGRLISQDLANSIVETNTIFEGLDLRLLGPRPLIMQIGAGYGCLSHVIARAIECRLVIFDVAPALQLATYYLSSLFPSKKIFRFRPFSSFAEIANEFEGADIAFFTVNQIEFFSDKVFDVGISVGFLYEMSIESVSQLCAQMYRTVRRNIYFKQYYKYMNECDKVTVKRDHYPLHPEWEIDYDRKSVTDNAFFERRLRRRDPIENVGAVPSKNYEPRIGLLLANYNDSRFLYTSLEGILAQTWPFDEIIIVDDGSDDASPKVIEEFCRRDDRIRFITLGRRRGQYHAIQRAVREATADFVVWAASDDLLMPDFVATNLEAIRCHPDVGLVFSRLCTWTDGTNSVLEYHGGNHGPAFELGSEPRHLTPPDLQALLRRHYLWISGNTVVVRRSLLLEQGGFEQALKWHADWFAYYVIAIRNSIVGVPRTLAMMRERPQTYSGAGMRDATAQRNVLRSILNMLKESRYFDLKEVFRQSPSLIGLFGTDFVKVIIETPGQIYLLPALLKCYSPAIRRWFDTPLDAFLRSRFAPAFLKARLLPPEAMARIWQAFNSLNYDEAIRLIEEATSRGAKDPTLNYVMGLSLHLKGERLHEALRHYNLAYKRGFDRSWTLMHRGRLRIALGDRGGRKDLEVAARFEGEAGQEARAHLTGYDISRLWSAFFEGRRSDGVTLAEKLLRAGMTDPVIHYVLGLCLHDNEDRREEALQQYELALEKGFDPHWIIFHRGRLRISMGDEGGWADLETARSMDGAAGDEAAAFLAACGRAQVIH